jgi:hypothetical protein|tara:strand:- start:10 stop:597 length:588 start_codon:yes stop_codon:yes gene_type:complete
MANRNSAGFGLIPVGCLGSTPATGGQSKYYIEAAYGTSMFQGSSVRVVLGYITTAQAAITNTTTGVLNGVFYNAATTLKPTWQNYYSDVTPANSENTTAFVIDNPFQLYNVSADAALTQAQIFTTMGLTVTAAGSTSSGQSSSELTVGTVHVTNNQWRVVRSAEDPENKDITAANATFVVVQNLNQIVNSSTAAS